MHSVVNVQLAYAVGPLFGASIQKTRARAAVAVAKIDAASADMWPWVFRALGYHLQRKGTKVSAINADMWPSAVMAEHSDYTAAGTMQLARGILQEAGRDETADMKTLMADMPEDMRGPPPGYTSGPAHSKNQGNDSQATEADESQTQGDGAGPSRTENLTDKTKGRRMIKEVQDYNKLAGGGTAQKKAAKRPSVHSQNLICVGKLVSVTLRPAYRGQCKHTPPVPHTTAA